MCVSDFEVLAQIMLDMYRPLNQSLLQFCVRQTWMTQFILAKLCEALTSFNSKRLCYQCLVLQFLLRRNLPLSFDHLVCLCAQFFVLFHLAWLTFSISAVDNVCVFGVFNVHPND